MEEQENTSRYVVFDVETPNRLCDRMSAIGITVIENGKIADEYYSLVDPETHFDYFNVKLTGISEKTVKGAPTFKELWTQIEPYLDSGILVAHNAVFDMSVLKRCLSGYSVRWKDSARYLCTVQIGRRIVPDISHKLNVMCEYYGIELNHHHAQSDSRACAEILLRYIQTGADISSYIKTYKLRS